MKDFMHLLCRNLLVPSKYHTGDKNTRTCFQDETGRYFVSICAGVSPLLYINYYPDAESTIKSLETPLIRVIPYSDHKNCDTGTCFPLKKLKRKEISNMFKTLNIPFIEKIPRVEYTDLIPITNLENISTFPFQNFTFTILSQQYTALYTNTALIKFKVCSSDCYLFRSIQLRKTGAIITYLVIYDFEQQNLLE